MSQFSLVHGFVSLYCTKQERRVVIVGLDHAGKTTLLEQLKGLYGKTPGVALDKIGPTVGLNLAKLTIDRYRVTLWDVGGQAAVRALWERYFADAHAVIFVVDASDPARFPEARETLEGLTQHTRLHGKPFLVLANKQDVEGACSSREINLSLRVESHSVERDISTHAVSALTCSGVTEAVGWLMDQIESVDEDGAGMPV